LGLLDELRVGSLTAGIGVAENSPDQSPEADQSQTAVTGNDACPSCRGRGRKFVVLRRSDATAGAAAETALLGRVQAQCLSCLGTGKAAS
jgi:hypothetical protein